MNDASLAPEQHRAPIGPSDGFAAWNFSQIAPTQSDVDWFLDEAADWLSEPELIPVAWPHLLSACEQLRRAAPDDAWVAQLRRHRIGAIMQEEPATSWSTRIAARLFG